MTRFLDGPAAGITLPLKRAVVFLRVVQDSKGKWDALDQLEDKPKRDEKLLAYHISSNRGSMHINYGGGRGGFYPVAEYRFIEQQPSDEVMRDNEKWTSWCFAEYKKEEAEKESKKST